MSPVRCCSSLARTQSNIMAEKMQCSNFPPDSDLHDMNYDSCTSSSFSTVLNSISDGCSPSFSCASLCSLDRNGISSARSSISCDRPLISLACNANKPHKANDAAWEAIRSLRNQDGSIGPGHFRLLHKVGSGDIGKVYVCQLKGVDQNCLFAMKMVDKEALAHRNKAHRAEVERQILSTLDHPFLPTLYAHFETFHYSCLVMEFCPGGDLHSLRLRQHANRFSLQSARFYAAEVLLALEYLHMMGVIYRDLKPENVLVRGNGHIMLSDFDLSFRCHVAPTLQKICRPSTPPEARESSFPASSSSSSSRPGQSSTEPAIPSCASMLRCNCFSENMSRLPSHGDKDDKRAPQPEFVAEPTEARSRSFVGTHEYLAPEVISGKGHGSAVDWWSLGIFLHEMLYAKTPFKGATKEKTLLNIITQPLRFPERDPDHDWDLARDLIKRLLVKDPRRRLGSIRGAADIKRHPFFMGVNWALIRSTAPPEIHGRGITKSWSQRKKQSLEIPPYFEYF